MTLLECDEIDGLRFSLLAEINLSMLIADENFNVNSAFYLSADIRSDSPRADSDKFV